MTADIVGPDQKLSHFVNQFVKELDEDFQSPTISKFQDYMPECRTGLIGMEDVSGRGWTHPLTYTSTHNEDSSGTCKASSRTLVYVI